jgi:hypothetical protein
MELSVILTFTVMFSVMFLMLGLVGGWIFKQYQIERMYGVRNLHPEFFDDNGNVVPDEVLAISFNPDYFDDDDDECDED